MAIAITKATTLIGLDAHIIEVEANVSFGLNNFSIVGLPDGAVKESRERIISAINNVMVEFPIRKIVVNLAPADIKKTGTGFDLPIALAILEACRDLPAGILKDFLIIGELSLEGKIRPVKGVLSMVMGAQQAGIQKIIVPQANAVEAALVRGLSIYPVETLKDVLNFLHGQKDILPQAEQSFRFNQPPQFLYDFAEVKGQSHAKRALQIAAAGNHNVLFIGPPGSGKSMLAKCFPSILPPLTLEEALEVTKIHSINGSLVHQEALMQQRPFRNPHHSISSAGLIGGGSIPRPGEVSLAHRGVLFLDEFPEYPRKILDLMRQPLEDHAVTIARANMSIQFPAHFLLLAAMNPCPCGFLGDPQQACQCSQMQIQKYRARISGPLIDRIDLQLEVPRLSYTDLNYAPVTETSAEIYQKVKIARQVQQKRFQNSSTLDNGSMTRKELQKHCQLNQNGHQYLSKIMQKMAFSARAHDRILKVARTIADLEQSPTIEIEHLGEAVNYRCLDREIYI